MALVNLFQEIDKALLSYDNKSWAEWVQDQSSVHETEMVYDKGWFGNVLIVSLFRYLAKNRVIGKNEFRGLVPDMVGSAQAAVTRESTQSKWIAELGLVRAPNGKQFNTTKVKPKDPQPNDVWVEEQAKGDRIILHFYGGYTQGRKNLVPGDTHLRAQYSILNKAMKQFVTYLAHDDKLSAIHDDISKEVYDPKMAQAGDDPYYRAPITIPAHGARLHGGTPNASRTATGTARSDTTARMMQFLDKMSTTSMNPEDLRKGTTGQAVGAVKKDINKAFNAAYKIEGLGEIDIFNTTPEILKQIKIKIVFGTLGQNALQRMADKGEFVSTHKSLDGKMAKIRDDLLKNYSNPNKETSLSMAEMMRRGVFAKVAKEMKTASGMPDMRFKINKKLYADALYKEQQKKLRSLSLQKASTKVVSTQAAKSVKMTGKSRSKQKMRTAENPLALEALLNQALPKVVASKMTSPALNYRTGRFADSVEAKSVMVGPRGGVAVDYTYMKYPYQTFEPGFAQGSTQRDPRKIIGESVREIAQSIIGDKFLRVRRV